jgi:coniferyl-aldehyde dehydrogenase
MNAQLKPSAPSAEAVDLGSLLHAQQGAQKAHTSSYVERIADLRRLRTAFKARLPEFVAAIAEDFGQRSWHESVASDGMPVLREIDHICKHLRRWMRASPRRVDINFLPARAEVRFQPVGVVGIIAPWNYPVNLALAPLVSALAAGNRVMLKPSEHTPRTSELLQQFLSTLFPRNQVACVTGDAAVAAAFAALPFDHLFFTGSTQVGRMVMAAAAPNLTPVTLELGGKSPAILAPDYSLDGAAQKIAAGKFFNGGQTCIAPDYVLLPQADQATFVAALRAAVSKAYPDLDQSKDYTSIVNQRQFDRLTSYLEDARSKGASVIHLAESTATGRRVFPPTVVTGVNDSMKLMQDEIFGPILPLVDCPSVDAAIDYINARPRPLALYHFDHDRRRTERVLDRTIAGGVSINDTLFHFAQDELPFGGIGASGMGHYHGHAGFLTFSKQKPVFYQSRFSALSLFRPPYGKLADRLVAWLTR